jgi:hypothetical protein
VCGDALLGRVSQLLTQGTNIYFTTTAPSQQELDKNPHAHLTLDTEWDPHSIRLSATRSEEADIHIGDDHLEPGLLLISSVFSDYRMAELLPREINVKAVDIEPGKTFRSSKRHPSISSEQLSERWAIGLNQAKQTIQVTTQRGARSAILPLSRSYRTDRIQHMCPNIRERASICQSVPMESKAMTGKALRQFIRDFGVPERLTSDGASEQVGPNTDFMKNIRKYEIEHHVSEPGRPLQNRAESVIREVKRRWFRLMVKQKVPKDFGTLV